MQSSISLAQTRLLWLSPWDRQVQRTIHEDADPGPDALLVEKYERRRSELRRGLSRPSRKLINATRSYRLYRACLVAAPDTGNWLIKPLLKRDDAEDLMERGRARGEVVA